MLRRLKDCTSGNVAMLFALALVPVLGTVGVALDYARAANSRAQLSAAIDATALALAHAGVNLTPDEQQDLANRLFAANFETSGGVTPGQVRVNREAAELSVTGTASIETSFLGALGIEDLAISGTSKVAWGATKVEVVLALDNTGSMAGDKLKELKTAANELIDSLGTISNAAGSVKIGLVPFATTVRLDPDEYIDNEGEGPDWIRFDDITYWDRDRHGNWRQRTRAFDKEDWEGCIQDRDQPNDVTDIISGETSGYDPDKRRTLYPAIEDCPSQERNLQTVQPLTSNLNLLKSKVANMTAAGNTNVTIGIAWGLAMLSHAAPFEEGSEEVGPGAAAKYLIVLTDGENTQNRFSNNTEAIDERTKLACKAARDAGTVFTIRVIDGDQGLLESCASKGKGNRPMFHDVQAAHELPQVFRAIANEIANLRISG